MIGENPGSSLEWWQRLLEAAEITLALRGSDADGALWTARELAVIAAERDLLAEQWDELAAAFDQRADVRDRAAEDRDVRASHFDRDHPLPVGDRQGFADRLLAAEHRDDAAGDRADSREDRRRSAADRNRAQQARNRDHDTAPIRAAERAELGLEDLQRALTDRITIGHATGWLMGRHDLSAPRATAMLSALSQQSGLRISVVAQRLVTAASRAPGTDPTGPAALSGEHGNPATGTIGSLGQAGG